MVTICREKPPRAPHRAHLKLFLATTREENKRTHPQLPSNSKTNKKNDRQEADAARDELAATSARDGPAFLELCDRLREQR